ASVGPVSRWRGPLMSWSFMTRYSPPRFPTQAPSTYPWAQFLCCSEVVRGSASFREPLPHGAYPCGWTLAMILPRGVAAARTRSSAAPPTKRQDPRDEMLDAIRAEAETGLS